jgi:hypothetical protein
MHWIKSRQTVNTRELPKRLKRREKRGAELERKCRIEETESEVRLKILKTEYQQDTSSFSENPYYDLSLEGLGAEASSRFT